MQQHGDRMMGRLARNDGFTIVELLVATLVSLALFSATMYVLENYLRSSQRTTNRNDAQDQARLAVDRIVRQLRNISSPQPGPALFERATPYDVVFQTVGTPSGSNTAGIQRVRYCVPQDSSAGSPSLEVLVSQTQTWSTATTPTNPWPPSATTIPCPDTSTSTHVNVANWVTNRYQQRTDRPLFTYNGGSAPSYLAQITSVQLDLFLNTDIPLPVAETELRSTVFVRNQNRPPVASFTYTAIGGGDVLLNGGSSYDPDGQPITYSWSCTSPSPCNGSATLAGAGTGLVDWTPGAGTYTVSLTITDPSGLTATATQPVTVT